MVSIVSEQSLLAFIGIFMAGEAIADVTLLGLLRVTARVLVHEKTKEIVLCLFLNLCLVVFHNASLLAFLVEQAIEIGLLDEFEKGVRVGYVQFFMCEVKKLGL